ncbi:hypothetical protein [Sulfurospirillum multivorans]|uniref:Uncharacterized protein n=2 Tax=Sulfurospirillum multivorans TaxID=66821 RepID=A0AA86ANW9_SULMK|nr:hypothetical protein [Sulfurospirillum multivorans]AHJ13072.1 hypothetical protein SMUL_1817 [Sulfurospirillum multivorans DSM 12446]QEH06560.1 hypothetical protein SMN_1795 [Sulfurospirillum multivorans]
MQPNQLFAMFLKACGVEAKFKKQGDVYKTYSKTQRFIFDPVNKVVTYLKPITKFVGGQYEHDTEWERYRIDDNNGQLTIAPMA